MEQNRDYDSSAEHRIRLEKVKKIEKQGLSAWPAAKEINTTCQAIIDTFQPDTASAQYEVAGRLMAIREHGKIYFCNDSRW